MKNLSILVAVAALAVAGAASAQAVAPADSHASHHGSELKPAEGYTEAEVRKVDKEAGKITLKHGAIANLDMPPMSMVFRARDAALLEGIKQGDKVRFKAEKIDGALTVTALEPAK